MKKNRHHKKLIIILGLMLVLSSPILSFADSVTDYISVYIGYFGWSEDEYIEKARYHWSELDDLYGGCLDTHEELYSYYNGSRTYLALARGFYVKDLLELAGVDENSIASIDFFTKDHSNGAYRSFTKKSLFDTPRYYFPYIAANEETGEIYSYDEGTDLWIGATQVEPMLALEDYTQWDAVGCEFEAVADSSLFSAGNRFHLFFGQAYPQEKGTSSAAKYVYKILVTFNGTPEIGLDQTDMNLKIGSSHGVLTNVYAEDDLLNEYVSQHISWSSSDESVVTVDSEGRLTALSDGTAVITASYGNTSVSKTVVVGTGIKNDRGELSLSADSTDESTEDASTAKLYMIASSAMQPQSDTESISAGEQMSVDAVQLTVTEQDEPSLLFTVCLIAAFIAIGFAFGTIRFKRLQH